jgi:hypothetical protein
MKPIVIALAVCLTLGTRVAVAQPVETLITEGRALLELKEIQGANAKFAAAVSLAPNHETANALHAFSRLAALLGEAPTQEFLDRLGVSATGRILHAWNAPLPKDDDGVLIAPEGVNAEEFLLVLRTNVLPAVEASERNLAKVTSPTFRLELSAAETFLADVVLDRGDILLIRAGLNFFAYAAYRLHAQNFDVQLTALRELYDQGALTAERVLAAYPQLLTFATTNDLASARAAFEGAVSRYSEASEFIRARPAGVLRLFNLDEDQTAAEERFRVMLSELQASLEQVVRLTMDDRISVHLEPHFRGEAGWRSFLPAFSGNGFVLGTLPDLTLGGMVFGLEETEIEDRLARTFVPVPVFQPPLKDPMVFQVPLRVVRGRGYVVEATGDFETWEVVTAFFALDSAIRFSDPKAFEHQKRFYRIVDRTSDMPPPPNDHFADRFHLEGFPVATTGYLRGGTREQGESLSGELSHATSTVWWSWTAPASGHAMISTLGNNVDTRLAVYTGSTLESLNLLTTDEGSSSNPTSHVEFAIAAGTAYQIVVGGNGWSSGQIQLHISLVPAPLATITVQASPSSAGTVTGGGSYMVGSTATVTATPLSGYQFDNWREGTAVVSTSSQFTFEVSSNRLLTAVFIPAPTGGGPANDHFDNAFVLSGTLVRATGTNIGASREPGEPTTVQWDNIREPTGNRSVWWRWVAPVSGAFTVATGRVSPPNDRSNFDTQLGIYTGTVVNALTEIASNEDTPNNFLGGGLSEATFLAVAGTTYHIMVNGWQSQQGNIVLHIWEGGPIHSIGVAANPLSAGSVSGGGMFPWGRSISLTATPGAGFYFLNWTEGGTVVSTDPVYTFLVTGNRSLFAQFSSRPPNDDFAGRTELIGANVAISASNVGATRELGEPSHLGFTKGHSVWWTWTAPVSGEAIISTTGSSFDTILAVYTGKSLTSLEIVAEDDDSGGERASKVQFNAVAGTTYQIAVDGYGLSSGSIELQVDLWGSWPVSITLEPSPVSGGIVSGGGTLLPRTVASVIATPNPGYAFESWQEGGVVVSTSPAYTFTVVEPRVLTAVFVELSTGGPASDDFASSVLLMGSWIRVTGDNFGATKEPGEPTSVQSGTVREPTGNSSVWWRWIAPASGEVTVATGLPGLAIERSTFDTQLGIYTGIAVNALTEIASNEDAVHPVTGAQNYLGQGLSELKFLAIEGTTYHIMVNGWMHQQGSIVLHLRLRGTPVHTVAVSANPGEGGIASGGGTFQAGQTLTVIAAPNSGFTFLNWTEAGNIVSTELAYTFVVETNRQLVANFYRPPQVTITVQASPGAGGTVSGGGSYAPGDSVTLTATPNQGFRFESWVEGGVVVNTGQTFTFTAASSRFLTATFVPLTSGAPATDDFASAPLLTGSSVRVTGTNVGATREPGEPTTVQYGTGREPTGNRSVWWRWIAPASGPVTMATGRITPGSERSTFDTQLGVYKGTAVNALMEIASNEDAIHPTTGAMDYLGQGLSELTFSAVEGTVYYIMINGWQSQQGNIVLHIMQP